MSRDVIWIGRDGQGQRLRPRLFSLLWWLVLVLRASTLGHELPWRLPSGAVISRADGVLVVSIEEHLSSAS